MKRTFTEEQAKEIAKRYEAGESSVKIGQSIVPGKVFNSTTILNTLKYMGVKRRPVVTETNPVVTAETLDAAVAACLAGGHRNHVAKQFGIGTTTLTRALQRAQVKLPQGRPPSCEINHTAFDILTPDVAYWIGFLWGDGAIGEDGLGAPAVKLQLAIKDKAHVEKFRAFIGSTHAITDRLEHATTFNGGACVSFTARSKPLTDVLRRYGFVVRREKPPAPELIASRDFWRGVVDSDGTVGIVHHDAGTMEPYVAIFGQRPLADAFKQFAATIGVSGLSDLVRDDGLCTVSATKKAASIKILDCLYTNCGTVLERKKARADAIIRGQHEWREERYR